MTCNNPVDLYVYRCNVSEKMSQTGFVPKKGHKNCWVLGLERRQGLSGLSADFLKVKFPVVFCPVLTVYFLKALSHLDDLASVCRFMKKMSKTLAHVEYVMGKFCIR